MSGPSKDLATPSETSSSQEGQQNRSLKVTLLSSGWRSSTDREVSTISRKLAIQLAKHPNVEVSVFLPKCSEEDQKNAGIHQIQLVEADELPGHEPIFWLSSLPRNHDVDCVIGHGVHLGKQIPLIKRNQDCRWIQVVHSVHEEVGMYQNISEGQQLQQTEVELCKMADEVVAIGPKVAETYERCLCSDKEEETILDLTPGIFSEFLNVAQAIGERKTFCVLVIGSGDSCKDFDVKGFNMAAEAIAELKDASYQLKFLYSLREDGKEIAEKLLQHGISRNQLIVRNFDDNREVLTNLFCEVDLAIMPSRTEGFGLPGLEALSAGLPVLVSGNSGLGEALKEVPLGSQCVVDSEDSKDWAREIRDVRQKRRKVRLSEAKLLREHYAKAYEWEKPCTVLVKKMQTLTFGSSGSRLVKPVRDKTLTSVADTCQACKRPRKELTDGTYHKDLSESKLAKPVRDKRPTSVADTSQACERPREELTDGTYHKGSSGSRLAKPVRDKRLTSVAKDTTQACERPRKELRDGMYHKGLVASRLTALPVKDERLSSIVFEDQLSNQFRQEFFHHDHSTGRDIPPFQESGQTQGDSTANDHDLSVITKHLRAEYNRRSLLKPLLWENTFKLPLDDVYTKLSVVSRRITDFRLEDRTVNMFDVFKTVNKDDDSMVLVEGSPGIGKTTFCLKISHDWANQKIPSESAFPVFKLLLLLKCRDICGDVIDAIVDQLLPMEGKVKEKLVDYIKDVHNQENILVILDGLDELPAAGESHVDKLLRRRMLPLCYVLATSRQGKGIEVRQKVDFDVILQIEGFTTVDSFEYIRKHFSHLGLDHVAKGERLIQSILENTFLHALPSNPLNLLLLCVVFEDYEGNLPSSRTELYHIIVRCLLRRYCAKNNVKAAADDKALKEQFKDSLLALGQLAWRCLQNDRFSFREEELAELESTMETLAARKLGLVFKEASAKKINPWHEYHFFHKTFQEYLAALYLAHKLLEERVNVFHNLKLSFADITRKYKQVFIFVSGIMSEATCNLFRQIGENLKVECWNWLNCTEEEATFFTGCFSESGEAEQMAMTLCSFIPFPQSVTCRYGNKSIKGVLRVANACKNFLLLQLPIHLTVYLDICLLDLTSVGEFLTSYSRLETIAFFSEDFTEQIPDLVYNALQVNSSLHSFTLQNIGRFSTEEAAAIGDHFAANKTLQTVTLKLPGKLGEHWATVLEKRLSGDTPLTSVVLEISGSVRKSGMVALNNFLRNRSLQSFGLTIYGDMHDSLATSVAEGLAADPYLKSLTLTVCGSVSCSAFISLKKGVVENSTLRSLVLKVFGELPENWINICKALYLTKKSSLSLTIEPDVVSKITTSQVACLRPLLLEERLGVLKLHSLTVKMWGELSCTGASDLCKLLIASRVSCVNLSIYGRVTDDVATCLVKNFDKLKSLSNLSINIRGEVTRDGESTLEALTCNQKFSSTLNVHDVGTVDEICEEVELSVVDSSSLTSAFTNVETICSRVSKVSMNFDSPIYSSEEDWGRSVGDFLAKFVSLTTLRLSLNCSGISEGWIGGFWSGFAQNTSITTLSITFNSNSCMRKHWMGELGSSLAQNTSITMLSITVNSNNDRTGGWMYELGSSLAQNTSITMLSITVNINRCASGYWMGELVRSLAQNTSITTLSITVSSYNYLREDWMSKLGSSLAQNTSITTLSITVNNYNDMKGYWMGELGSGLAKNRSITSLSITVNSNSYASGYWMGKLGSSLAQNRSITTLSITANSYDYMPDDWMGELGSSLAQSTSITTLSITVNSNSYMSGYWMGELGSGLAQSTSITMLSITVNSYSYMSGDWMGELGSSLAHSTSITTLSITFNNYGNMSGDWMGELGSGLAQNTSITMLSITVNNHSDMHGEWMRNLRSVVAQITSLAILNLTLNDHTNSYEDWINKFCQASSRITSSIKTFLEVNLFSESNEKP